MKKEHKKPTGTMRNQPGTMKNQSGAGKNHENMVTVGNEWLLVVVTGDSKVEVIIFRYSQTDGHFIMIYK